MKKQKKVVVALAVIYLVLAAYRFISIPEYQAKSGGMIFPLAVASAILSPLALVFPIYLFQRRGGKRWWITGILFGVADHCAAVIACNLIIIYAIEGRIPPLDFASHVLGVLCIIAIVAQVIVSRKKEPPIPPSKPIAERKKICGTPFAQAGKPIPGIDQEPPLKKGE